MLLFFSPQQEQGDITGSVKRASTLAIPIIPVAALAATVISSSHAIAARPSESTFPEDDELGQTAL
jgi:hypothetical protein